MKKLLFSLAISVASFSYGQFTLENSFPEGENVFVYSTPDDTFYVSEIPMDEIRIYNSDYSLKKTVKIPIPKGYEIDPISSFLEMDYQFNATKHLFNDDDKLEFIASCIAVDTTDYTLLNKLFIFNEDGELIKDFHPNPKIKNYNQTYDMIPKTNSYNRPFEIFIDKKDGKNKMIVYNEVLNEAKDNGLNQTDLYILQSTKNATLEIQSKSIVQSKSKLFAYPIPTSKTLNIINPKNGSSQIDILDMSGKTVISKSFNTNEHKISVDVENLPKGKYIYKIGNQSSNIIKN